jgi:hypothetical protein
VVIETAPGEEAQVDYGTGPIVRDPQRGKYRRTRLFVLTLGHSRKSVQLLVFRSSWLASAEIEPFRYYLFGERTVHIDGCVEVEAAYYGKPPGWIGRRVHLQWNAAHGRLYRCGSSGPDRSHSDLFLVFVYSLSNRPVEDRGKLLADFAAVGAMLDRLLHRGHMLKCGPRGVGAPKQ